MIYSCENLYVAFIYGNEIDKIFSTLVEAENEAISEIRDYERRETQIFDSF